MSKNKKYKNLETNPESQITNSELSYDAMTDLFDSNTGDITIKLADEEDLLLHISILKQVPTFSTILETQKIIDLAVYDTASVKMFLKYLYKKQLPKNISECINIYNFGNIFGMENKDIREHILKQLTDDNICEVLNLAEKFNLAALLNDCIEFLAIRIRKHTTACYDLVEPGGYIPGLFREAKYTVPNCCYHYMNKRHLYSNKFVFDEETIINSHASVPDRKHCIYNTIRKVPVDQTCSTHFCCEHRGKYRDDFIDKLTASTKDALLKKLIHITY
jgi:hypothetical protein